MLGLGLALGREPGFGFGFGFGFGLGPRSGLGLERYGQLADARVVAIRAALGALVGPMVENHHVDRGAEEGVAPSAHSNSGCGHSRHGHSELVIVGMAIVGMAIVVWS